MKLVEKLVVMTANSCQDLNKEEEVGETGSVIREIVVGVLEILQIVFVE